MMDDLLGDTYKDKLLESVDRLVLSQCIRIRRIPMPLSQDTQTKINQAFTDQQAAQAADQNVTVKDQALTQAQSEDDSAKTDSLDKHKTALDSAHTAIAALMSDLGVPPSPPAPPTT